MLVTGDCRGGLCGRKPGAALHQTRVVLFSSKTDLLQNTAEPTHHMCGYLSEKVFKSKKHSWKREGGTKSEIQRTEEEEQLLLSMLQTTEDSMLEQRDISWRNCVPWRTQTAADFSRGLMPMERTCTGLGKKHEKGMSSRDVMSWADWQSPHFSPHTGREACSEGMK